jgi:hypothetical protein
MAKPVGTGTFSNLLVAQALGGRQVDKAKVRGFPSGPGAKRSRPIQRGRIYDCNRIIAHQTREQLCALGSGPYMRHEALVGVKCKSMCGCALHHARTAGCLWVP